MSKEYYLPLAQVKEKLYALLNRVHHRRLRAAQLNPGTPTQPWDETKREIGDILDWIKTQEVRGAATEEVKPADDRPKCELCGELMPPGEEMFKYHGYSGDCPKPPLPKAAPTSGSDPSIQQS